MASKTVSIKSRGQHPPVEESQKPKPTEKKSDVKTPLAAVAKGQHPPEEE
jgi:hypothetical protein